MDIEVAIGAPHDGERWDLQRLDLFPVRVDFSGVEAEDVGAHWRARLARLGIRPRHGDEARTDQALDLMGVMGQSELEELELALRSASSQRSWGMRSLDSAKALLDFGGRDSIQPWALATLRNGMAAMSIHWGATARDALEASGYVDANLAGALCLWQVQAGLALLARAR